jgi:hypothetical protein
MDKVQKAAEARIHAMKLAQRDGLSETYVSYVGSVVELVVMDLLSQAPKKEE